jgi:hypothetical protein
VAVRRAASAARTAPVAGGIDHGRTPRAAATVSVRMLPSASI